MSYEENRDGNRQVNPDRAIQLISEARVHDDFLYRTLLGNKLLPHVVYQLEHFTILYDVVNDVRRRTLEKFSRIHRNTLISTTSIDGKMLQILTESRIRHMTEVRAAKKNFGGGLFGGGSDGAPAPT
ncbi:MAG: hypothetical protein FJ356_01605 [Thaumarchaeota archaeon]|nr:hypothetical protein [Nitrososphaerota archaeon]